MFTVDKNFLNIRLIELEEIEEFAMAILNPNDKMHFSLH